MENSKDLATRFREVVLDGKWIANTNYKEQLADLSKAEATYQVADLNTIAALTFHINYYIAGINKVFEGGDLEIRDKYSFDLPEIISEEEWQLLKDSLLSNAESFYVHVQSLTEAQLESSFVKADYGNYRRNIEGVIEHSYYHLGQIVILKRLVLAASVS